MSRIGKKPVAIPSGVTAKVDGQTIEVKGAEGRTSIHCATTKSRSRSTAAPINVEPHARTSAPARMWGTSRALIANLIAGVTKGFEKKLEINGVGYKAAVAGQEPAARARLQPRHRLSDPAGVTIATPKPTEITIAGIDKRQVGQVAAEIRAFRAARALQGQGREICRRIHLPQGRQEEVRDAAMAKSNTSDGAAQGARPPRDRSRMRAAARGSACSARRSRSTPRSSTTSTAVTLAAASSLEKAMREIDQDRRQHRGRARRRQGARRAGKEGRRREGRVRSRRLHVSRPRQGAGRGRPRGRPRILTKQGKRRRPRAPRFY